MPRSIVLISVIGCLLLPIYIFNLNGPLGHYLYVLCGAFFGTVWSQVTIAAVWFALRRAPLSHRLRGAALWVGGVVLAMVVATRFAAPSGGDPVVIFALCLLGQWTLLQLPLTLIRRAFGVELRKCSPVEAAPPLQFGVRHLLLFTAVIATALGVGRLLLHSQALRSLTGDVAFMIELTIGAMLATLPLSLSLFVRRGVVPAALVAAAFSAVVPWAEFQLMSRQMLGPMAEYMLAWIFAFQTLWLFALCGLLRFHGYRLLRVTEKAS